MPTSISFPTELTRTALVERVMFRMSLPLESILSGVELYLNEMSDLDAKTGQFLASLPQLKPCELDTSQECSICELIFNQIPPVSIPSIIPTPIRLPCTHIVCQACLETWLGKAGTCPICRRRLTNRVFIFEKPQNETYCRSICEEILIHGRKYLATNPEYKIFYGFCEWAHREETESQRDARRVMVGFQYISTIMEDEMLQSEVGRRFVDTFWSTAGSEWAELLNGDYQSG